MQRERKNKEQISSNKDNNFSRWANDNNSSIIISNNSVKNPGSKLWTEESSNIINVTPVHDDKNMKDIATNIMNKKGKNNLRFVNS